MTRCRLRVLLQRVRFVAAYLLPAVTRHSQTLSINFLEIPTQPRDNTIERSCEGIAVNVAAHPQYFVPRWGREMGMGFLAPNPPRGQHRRHVRAANREKNPATRLGTSYLRASRDVCASFKHQSIVMRAACVV